MDLRLEFAALAHHIIKEMLSGLTARKTVVEGRLERSEFVHEPLHTATGPAMYGGDARTRATPPVQTVGSYPRCGDLSGVV